MWKSEEAVWSPPLSLYLVFVRDVNVIGFTCWCQGLEQGSQGLYRNNFVHWTISIISMSFETEYNVYQVVFEIPMYF